MPTLTLKHVLVLSFLVRLILIPFFSDDFNYWANLTFTSFLVKGYNPWTVTYNDPTLHWINPWRCPPLQLPLVIPPLIVNELTGNYILMLYAIKLPLVLIDILSIFFVYKILQMWSDNERKDIRYLLLFALNPISLWASAISGSTDPLLTLLLVMSVFFFLKSVENSKVEKHLSALFLGMSIAAKLFPVVFVPVFLLKLKETKERIVFVILAALPIVLVSLPFLIWDYGSYVNMILFLNVGGVNPFVTFLTPGFSDFLKVLLAVTSILMFGVAYFRKTNILINIVLAFLALYALMGFSGFDAKYFSWFIPFAVLLASKKETLRVPAARFLPFIYIPSLVGYLIYNGPVNSVEGMTGFFYFAYQWLRLKVVVFRVLPLSDLIYTVAGAASALLILCYFVAVAVKAPSFTLPAIKSEKLDIIHAIKKNYKLFLSLFLITLVSVVVFAKIVPYETMVLGVEVSNSNLQFYDNFSRSILNPQWGVAGNGNYTIEFGEKPSYIRLNGNITLYRGWGPTWQGFKESSEAQVGLVFKLDEIPQNVSESAILVTNGGWFGVMKENKTYDFVYYDQITNKTALNVPIDYQWHELTVYYDKNDRLASFDNESSIILSRESFSYICLGLPINSSTEMKGSSFSVDYVEVNVQNFYSNISSVIYVFLALFVPLVIISCTGVYISRRKLYHRGSS